MQYPKYRWFCHLLYPVINVRSRNWFLSVTTIDTIIDGKTLRQLAYRIDDDIEHSDQTIITIENFHKEDLPTVEAAIQNFYYPENTLLGELIWHGDCGSIYTRSEIQKPKDLPVSFDCGGEGIVFLAYQARGSFVAPVVICNHQFKTRDRDRKTIGKGTVQDVIDLSYNMSPQAAMYLLNSLRKFWYSYNPSIASLALTFAPSEMRNLVIPMFSLKHAAQ